jgi:hypothetical protein
MSGHGEKLTRKQEQAIAALLECSTIDKAAQKVGLSHSALKRWLRTPKFALAYRRARRQVLDLSVGRLQAAAETAVDALLDVAKKAVKDADRVRAATALLQHAFRGIEEADALHDDSTVAVAGEGMHKGAIEGTGDVVRVLAARLRQIDQSELPTADKARLTASLGDALLRAISVNVLAERLEALQLVLADRKGNGQ